MQAALQPLLPSSALLCDRLPGRPGNRRRDYSAKPSAQRTSGEPAAPQGPASSWGGGAEEACLVYLVCIQGRRHRQEHSWEVILHLSLRF